MKSKEEIAVAAAGLAMIHGRERDTDVGKLAGRNLDILLWVMDYPNQFKEAFELIKQLGIDGQEAVKKLDESKVIASTLTEKILGGVLKKKPDAGWKLNTRSTTPAPGPDPDGTVTE